MRVAEVIAPVVNSEEDLPLIYDIIRKKLKAGVQVWVQLSSTELRKVIGLEAVRSRRDFSLMISLTFVDPSRQIDAPMIYNYEPHRVQEAWKLKKEDDKWLLTIV